MRSGGMSNLTLGDGILRYFRSDSGGSTLNTFDPAHKSSDLSLSGGNLIVTCGGAQIENGIICTNSASSGKKYCEITITSNVSNGSLVGIANSSWAFGTTFLGQDTNGFSWQQGGPVLFNGSNQGSIQTFTNGTVCCIAVDFGNSRIWFRSNGGNWNNSGTADPVTNTGGIDISVMAAGPYFIGYRVDNQTGAVVTGNFGGSAYAQTAPSGFGNW
jgi:hypothetical protein